MFKNSLILRSMQIGFGLIVILAIGGSAMGANGAQRSNPELSVFHQSVGFLQSNDQESKSSDIDGTGSSAVVVPADYDGDGKMDLGTWDHATAKWRIQGSSGTRIAADWGKRSVRDADRGIPVPADFDGDGRADLALWFPASGKWHILNSSRGFARSRATISHWGVKGDIPVQADYDGDSKADLAVFRPTENRWYILESGNGTIRLEDFGIAGNDLLVPTDYTGDGKVDIAVYRRGTWLVVNSKTGEIEPFEFGFADALPVPGDYDGDGEIDFAVYRSGTWFVHESSSPRLVTYKFGSETDIPLSSTMAKRSIAGI